ncbi:DUF167 domain-containing protein [Actinobacteria bacterium YIM 96077]|uniref:UPF0235 protein DPM12_06875 n=1 Tax=Phytoactinopolyspora halophila TaxID=1981511 RepID=A0A329QX02_9ACTN|nr:DUF167 domain-containing protein [Phytoactinopolyspora halophila]AYY15379.1 DUF167 domain-containing protein [Actinobacteria bacterium YIM 96077]RAW16506.1 DUF167 domain-containing protein [Phytoactinopolyspora halophila]
MRVTVRVKPGSARPRVGGRHAGALVIAVRERAVDGKATRAALDALVRTLGCHGRDVRLVAGARSRVKTVEIPDELRAQFESLCDAATSGDAGN